MKILPQRKSIRLRKYDYSQNGAYFITICTQNRECLFGDIVDRKIIPNHTGQMINQWWLQTSQRFKNVTIDEYQIMPNHLHGIIVINNDKMDHESVGAGFMPARIEPTERATTRVAPTTLGNVIGTFKSLTTHEYIVEIKNNNWKPFDKRLWQRNYHEHIIRNEDDLNKIREYIKNNPRMWDRDRNNPNTPLTREGK